MATEISSSRLGEQIIQHYNLKKILFLLISSWTLLLGVILYSEIKSHQHYTNEMARTRALEAFNKDIAYRHWNTRHGGVYVPVTEETQPNPYLSHIPDRDLETTNGRQLTLINPAFMNRQVNDIAQEYYGMRGHITSLNPLRPGNGPDDWERDSLKAIDKGQEEVFGLAELEGDKYFRLIRPLYVKPACLKCHGHQGYVVGDVRGGITISIPAASYFESLDVRIGESTFVMGMLWLIGVVLMSIGMWKFVNKSRDRNNMVMAFQASQSLLEETQKLSQLGSWVYTPGPMTIQLSDETRRIFGFRTALNFMHFDDFLDHLSSDNRELVQTTFQSLFERGGEIRRELHISLPGDIDRWVELFGKKTTQPDKDEPVIMGFVQDITERKRSEQQIRNLAEAVEQNPSGIVITDVDAQIEYVNDAFTKINGFSREEVLGKNPKFLKSGNTPSSVYESLWSTVTRGEPWKGHFTNRRKNGGIFENFAVIAPIKNADGEIEHYVGIMEDITEKVAMNKELDLIRNHLEDLVKTRTEELEEARIRAEDAAKAKSMFLANMSHEIRTPMNAIIGLSHLLADTGLDESQLEQVYKITSSGQHLLSIINDILDFSKIDAGKLTLENAAFPLSMVIEKLDFMTRSQFENSGLSFEIDSDVSPVLLMGDSARLLQCLLNLSSNAMKFTQQGGVHIFLKTLNENEENIRIRFEVIDTGIGIEKDKINNLFLPFEQSDLSTTRRFGGTGLGLSITYSIVELMDGNIGVSSEPGKGSCFWMEIPFEKSKDQSVHNYTSVGYQEVTDSMRMQGLSDVRILLVEDDLINQDVARGLFKNIGLVPDIANNGLEAVEKVKSKEYDLVFMDVHMPEMNGLTATRLIREINCCDNLPIIALTASVFAEDRAEALESGMNDFISKPIEPSILFSKLLQWLPEKTGSLAIEPSLQAESGVDSVDESLDIYKYLASFSFIDVQQGLRSVANNMEQYIALIGKFFASHRNDSEEIIAALKEGDQEKARRLAHTVKGVSATLGLSPLHQAALQLEAIIKSNDIEDISEVESEMNDFVTELSRLDELLDGIGNIANSNPEDQQDVEYSDSQVIELLQEIAPLLAIADTQAIDIIESNKNMLITRFAEQGEQLIEMVDMFDFEAASKLLEQIRQQI